MADIALENRLRAENEARAECILSLTQKLVRTPSTSPPGNVSAVALVATDQIRQLIPKSDISTIETGPGIINVVAIIRSGRRGKRLVFSGHLDTYPTGEAGRWTLDPFSGELSSDGKHVCGRGGTSTNLVAETASASLDIRLPMGLSTATLIEQIKRILEPADGIRYDIVRAYEASWTPSDEEIGRHALEVTRLMVDEQATVNMRVGASDARLFRAAGIPSVIIGLTPHNMGGGG